METNQTIKANTQKKDLRTALIITVCCILFISILLFWGLKSGYHSFYSAGTGKDIPMGEMNPKYVPDTAYRGINWFKIPLYAYESAHALRRPDDTLLGMKINPFFYVERETWFKSNIILLIIICVFIISAPLFTYFIHCKMCKNTSLTITDTQATGSYSSFLSKKSVQLPLDKINNLTITNSFMDKLRGGETLGIATASGVIKMHFISNAEEIVSHVTALTSKCDNTEVQTSSSPEQNQTATDKLKELNNLKESGLITDEEFTRKREDILSEL